MEERMGWLLLIGIPWTKETIQFATNLLLIAIVVKIDSWVGIILKTKCGSYLESSSSPQLIETICLYNLPRLSGDYMILECFNSKCKYHLRVHHWYWPDDKLVFDYPHGIHRCVNEILPTLVLISPWKIIQSSHTQHWLIAQLNGYLSTFGGYNSFPNKKSWI